MRYKHHFTRLLTIATLIATPLTLAACGGHMTFDPYFNDYHRWNGSEDGYYRRWEGETGRSHLDFGRRPVAEQRAYFGWRHQR
ncbi:MAG TPA: hypothetical protein VGO75_01600 [Gemmatimonadaceae bacterium]|jgi:hypothetical protein|nr:hypothetical protein [Gemmatimonadaceae bacterium]